MCVLTLVVWGLACEYDELPPPEDCTIEVYEIPPYFNELRARRAIIFESGFIEVLDADGRVIEWVPPGEHSKTVPGEVWNWRAHARMFDE